MSGSSNASGSRPKMSGPRALTAWTVLLCALGLALAVLGPGLRDGARAQEREPALTAAQAIRAAELYSVHCARCHGAAGQGGVSGGEPVPPLRDIPVAAIDLVLRTNRMPPGDPLGQTRGPIDWTEEDRELLVAYLDRQFDLAGELPELPGEGDPARGREVYATNCAQCHGYTGAGGVAGGGAFTPQVSGLDPMTIAEAVRVGPFEMPRFADEQISAEELTDVAAYLTEVAHEGGTPLNLVELNPVYASAFVALLALLALFSAMFIAGRVTMFPDPAPGDHEDPRP